MQRLKAAWKEAAWVFGLSRLVIIMVSYISTVWLPQAGQKVAENCTVNLNPCILAWYHWDAVAYVNIAHHGYTTTSDVAFFPFWPLIIHFGGLLLGGYFPDSFYLAGLVLANIFFYLALVLLYWLLSEEFEPMLARRALVYFTFAPYALYFFAGYTESLFVLLSLAIFLLLRRGRAIDWWLAAILGFFAVLTRSSGVALVIPFLVIYAQRFWFKDARNSSSWVQKANALVPIILIPAGILAYMIYLKYAKGDPLLFISQEATFRWHRHFALPGAAFGPALGAIFTGPPFSGSALQNLLDTLFTLIPLFALAAAWKRIPLHYALFALGLALFALSFPQSSESLASQPRYMMSIFPIFAIFALWGKRPRFDLCYLAISLPLLALNVVLFTHHYWVA